MRGRKAIVNYRLMGEKESQKGIPEKHKKATKYRRFANDGRESKENVNKYSILL